MGELLPVFRQPPTQGLKHDLWADPSRLAARAAGWADEIAGLAATGRAALGTLLDRLPALFAGRPVVLARGGFAPVNMLTDGASLTGLLDFESVRLADSLFDPAWWAWGVGFPPSVLEAAWQPFLQGAGIDPADPQLPARVRSLRVLRMLELLATDPSLDPQIRQVVTNRLRAELDCAQIPLPARPTPASCGSWSGTDTLVICARLPAWPVWLSSLRFGARHRSGRWAATLAGRHAPSQAIGAIDAPEPPY